MVRVILYGKTTHLFSTGLIEGRFDYRKGLHVPGSRQTLYGDPLLNQFRNFSALFMIHFTYLRVTLSCSLGHHWPPP